MSSPLTTNEGNSYDARISLLETQLWSTNNTLMKILDNLRKMTDSYVTEDDADELISTKVCISKLEICDRNFCEVRG